MTDQNPEGKYEALEKYGRDLTEAARQGKLDPVIGRDDEIRREPAREQRAARGPGVPRAGGRGRVFQDVGRRERRAAIGAGLVATRGAENFRRRQFSKTASRVR